jgi:hypothetical protein
LFINSSWTSGSHNNNDEFMPPNELPYRRVFRSTDGGVHWEPLVHDSAGVPYDYITAFGMTVGRDGRLYVSDWGGLYIYDPEGSPVARAGTTGGNRHAATLNMSRAISGKLRIESREPMQEIRVTNIGGRLVRKIADVSSCQEVLELGGLGRGCYMVMVRTADGVMHSRRVVRE